MAGIWRGLPPAPIVAEGRPLSVWTGTEMLVFGRGRLTALKNGNVAAACGCCGDAFSDGAAYNPAANS